LNRAVSDSIELSIIMPCLNEAASLGFCIEQARAAIERSGLRGEIVVADNGSSDESIAIAEELRARVVRVRERGYGNALRGGIDAAAGKWIVIGDADGSYDFAEMARFLTKLREGCDLVVGCRLPSGGGRILPGAMRWQNRWIGNPALSWLGRWFFKSSLRDFHCGLRALTKSAFQKMNLNTTGMEFASEMIAKAAEARMTIGEVPVTLHKDRRSRASHLRPWRDGWRHLRFMLVYSPR
jgi:glycosyltransferase involved in cell wall biosynthesis